MEKTDEEWIAQLEQAIHDGRGWTEPECDYIEAAGSSAYGLGAELPRLPHAGDQWHFIEITKQFILSRVVRRLTDDEI